MKLRSMLGVLLLVTLIAGGTAWAYNYNDLQMAHSMRDRGDFLNARNLYWNIASSLFTDNGIRREAGYFLGFCNVKMNNSWAAIDDYRWFIKTFDDGNATLIPDAIFVLGRTYEVVNDVQAAINCYRSCLSRFPYTEFAGKSRERMNFLGVYASMDSVNYADSNGQPAVGMAQEKPGAVTVKASTKANPMMDPYNGFQPDQAKIKRVNTFLNAVKKMQGVDEAIRGLAPEDGRMGIIKQNLQMLQEKGKFNNVQMEK
ncbi:MAG: hypothetical protein HQM08_15255 [Candidatus Riflebacteria bacterium]|nr:hypothetical protein [Candidatus Riflebacteria bacterium]